MSEAVFWSIAAGIGAAAIGLLVTLFEWARARRTLLRAETAHESAKALIGDEANINLLQGPQERIDVEQAKAVSQLLQALGDTSEAVVRIGTNLVVKSGGRTFVRNLNTKELRYLDKNPQLGQSPDLIISAMNDPEGPFASGGTNSMKA